MIVVSLNNFKIFFYNGVKNFKIVLLIITTIMLFNSCKDFVSNTNSLIDQIEDSKLNDPAQIPFLISGLKLQFSAAASYTIVLSDVLSDQLYKNPYGTYDGTHYYDEIDLGTISLNNRFITSAYRYIGVARFYADNLVERVLKEKVTDQKLKRKAIFIGKFYGGYTRFLYAAYFGLSETNGGSPVNGSKFISSDKLYTQAINLFMEALESTNNPWQKRLTNSMIAKSYLLQGNYVNAVPFALKGLSIGDPPFSIKFSSQFGYNNRYYLIASEILSLFIIDNRFPKYIAVEPNEANRIKIDSISASKYNSSTIYFQVKYNSLDSPEDLITWQENSLMLAELALRNQASAGNALTLVNEVRSSHNIPPLNNVDLETIYIERDKELFCTGNRLPDERRFNKFHLPAGRWQYLPVPAEERDNNKNL